MSRVTARAWCRVDFAGGTLDIWPLGLLHSGAVTVNAAIDVATEVTLERRASGYSLAARDRDGAREADDVQSWLTDPDTALFGHLALALDLPPVDISIKSASPRGGGLGASSALAIAMIVAAEHLSRGEVRSADQRSRLARDVEARLMGLPTGRQDHLPALLGGVLAIAHRPGGEQARRLTVDLETLGKSLVVAYTGQSHFSAGNNWRIVRQRLDGDSAVVDAFEGIAQVAQTCAEALEAGDLARVGELMTEEWGHRRTLSDGISTPKIEELLETARRSGAWGGKGCGAGGGGCIAVLAPPEKSAAVAEALAETAQVLPARPVGVPLEIEEG